MKASIFNCFFLFHKILNQILNAFRIFMSASTSQFIAWILVIDQTEFKIKGVESSFLNFDGVAILRSMCNVKICRAVWIRHKYLHYEGLRMIYYSMLWIILHIVLRVMALRMSGLSYNLPIVNTYQRFIKRSSNFF